MSITREQAADLREINDVDERLLWLLRRAGDEWGATGVARVAARLAEPEPTLYVNHPRTEPAPGDVVRDADDEDDTRTWCTDDYHGHLWQRLDDGSLSFYSRSDLPARLRLLVDGETGMTVPS